MVSPTPRLIDLITQGIAQMQENDVETLYDREFARDILQQAQSLTNNQKQIQFRISSFVHPSPEPTLGPVSGGSHPTMGFCMTLSTKCCEILEFVTPAFALWNNMVSM